MDKFKATANDDGENWLICWTGRDQDGNHYNVTTDHVHASELYQFSRGAKGDAELIARLLSWYYRTDNAEEIISR